MSSIATAQGSRADYERAELLESETRNRVFRQWVQPNWLHGDANFWYRVQTGTDTFHYMMVDCEHGDRRDAFDHQRLASALATVAGQQVDPDRLPFRTLRFADDLQSFSFSAFDRVWQCELGTYEVTALNTDELVLETTVEQLTRSRRSRDGGPETTVRFVNQRDTPIDLFWVDRSGRQVAYGRIEAGQQREQHTYAGHIWLVKAEDGQSLAVFRATSGPGDAVVDEHAMLANHQSPEIAARNRAISPDGKWQATIRDHNVWLTSVPEGESLPLSHDGTESDPYLDRWFWSPDSTMLVAIQEAQVEQRTVHLIESSPPDQLQPKLHEVPYTKPGDPLPRPRPRLFDVQARTSICVPDTLFAQPWDISEIRWQPDSRRFTFLYNQRGHQILRLVAVDAQTGQASPLIDERSSTFIDYAHKRYIHYSDATGELIWMSERDGWSHLYRYDSHVGCVKNQITRGRWVVRRVDRVDDKRQHIWFYAGGIYPTQDPYYLHYCRVNFDGSHLVILTEGDGNHAIEMSPDGRFLIDRYSRADLPPVTELRSAVDGRLICELEHATSEALAEIGSRTQCVL